MFANSLNIDEPLVMHTSAGPDYFYSRDAMSVRAIIDTNANIVETYKYVTYGQPLIQDGLGDVLGGSAVGNTFMFTSRELDLESGLYNNRSRTYDPSSGRFLQEDHLGFSGGTNLFNYSEENPINNTDPMGAVPRSMVPQNIIDNARAAINNVTGNSFSPVELDIMTNMVIGTISLNPFATASLGTALSLGNVDAYSNPVLLTPQQMMAMDRIFQSLQQENLTDQQQQLLARAEGMWVTSLAAGRCEVVSNKK
jgi:RHS repeat-associated protein